ncbi:chemotaxis protein CheA [Lapillicoccus jejuensis]|uniref:Chemotaxis protein CheA n=1 Tax=Lapillicoccus jejuensis TaxID=402171 RepID=A0A542E4G6_9MICO|nr:chemotaxis protein CheA [Lapillicoccus jejuensis]TQJ10242.1 two-component system chemotaxis sensor kinase CheA [Lapillicoccus jejuensis]
MTLEEEMADALATLLVEAGELLEEMEAGLLDLDRGGDTQDVVHSIFRAAHTIKGSAGLFGLEHVVAFTHVLETVLDRVRAGEVAVTPALITVLLPCKDHIATLLDSAAGGSQELSDAQSATGRRLVAELEHLSSAQGAEPAPPTSPDTAADDAPSPLGPRLLRLSLRFGPDCLRSGMDPLSFIHYLSGLGDVVEVRTLAPFLPGGDSFDPESTYLAFLVTLRTDRSPDEVDAVFEFVRDESDIRVLEGDPGDTGDTGDTGATAAYDDLVESFAPHQDVVRSALLGPAPAGTDTPGSAAPTAPTAPTEPTEPTASPGAAARPSPTAARVGSAPQRTAETSEVRTIRVDAARLDRLIDTVGELVIAGAGAVAGLGSRSGDEALSAAVSEVTRLIEDVRDDALRLRMVPIGSTLSRFTRVVRDVSASLGKDVALTVTGGETEVDKALVEHIGDPLMHLVRNALDHGLESPERRVALGKPRRGSLELRARHDSGAIVVELADDGAGIDVAAVHAKAVERGLVEPGTQLSDKEVLALVFEPGFSTASSVSTLSGRGVGMDVVKRNVSALRGTIDIDSRPGEGTTVRIRLPLTLAIIDGFMVGVGATTFVVPLSQVLECVELPPGGLRRDYMDLRGEVLPLIPLRRVLDVDGLTPRRENVVVVECAGSKAGLVVDTLRGEFQTVIKPLGSLFAGAEGIGGSTILGDGAVALILDVPALVRHASTTRPPSTAPARRPQAVAS